MIGAINKRRNRIFSVSTHVRMLARQGGYDHPIDDQSAVIQARQHFFDEDLAAIFCGVVERGCEVGVVFNIETDANLAILPVR